MPTQSDRAFPVPFTYEISGAGHINYQFNDTFDQGLAGDPHAVVFILTINLGSH